MIRHLLALLRRLGDRERGSATLEAVVVVPAFLLLAAVVIAGGRVALAHQAVESAATEAARTASIERTAGVAANKARAAAHSSLVQQDLNCASLNVLVDTGGFGTAVGTAGWVEATVSCRVTLGDLGLPGLPGSMLIEESMRSPIDTYRER